MSRGLNSHNAITLMIFIAPALGRHVEVRKSTYVKNEHLDVISAVFIFIQELENETK